MKTSWINGLTEDLAKEIRGDFKSSRLVRNRLISIIEDKIKASHNASLLKSDYEIANWALKQADNVGFERALKEIIGLLTDD